MRFSIMFSVLAASAMVSAKMVVKRSPDDVTNALNTVSSNCDSLISQLNACQSDDCVTQLATQLANILNQCPAKVEAFTCTAATDDTAQAGADLANKIAQGIEAAKNTCGNNCPGFTGDVGPVDKALASCFQGVANLCPQFQTLLGPKLTNTKSTFKDIGFTATPGAAGQS